MEFININNELIVRKIDIKQVEKDHNKNVIDIILYTGVSLTVPPIDGLSIDELYEQLFHKLGSK